MSKISAKEMARAVETWYPPVTQPGKAFDKAMSLFEVSGSGFWRQVAGLIVASGKNRAQRRKDKKKSLQVNS